MSIDRTAETWREDWALQPMDRPESRDQFKLATEIMDIMEQGIVVWSADGLCELFNARVHEVLDLGDGELGIGTSRGEFRRMAAQRGLLSEEAAKAAARGEAENVAVSFDLTLPGGRVVLASGRPAESGSYVITFTDVTDARRAEREVASAMATADAAEATTRTALAAQQARAAEMSHLSELDEWLQSCKTLQELYMIVTKFMSRVMTGTYGELYIFSSTRDVLDGVGSWSGDQLNRHIAPDSCWALRRGRHYIHDPAGISFVCGHVDHPPEEDFPGEYLCIPIVAHGDTVGLLHVRFESSDYCGERLRDAETFTIRCAEHISMAVANVRLRDELHDQSIRDPLTGLYNRRHFMSCLRREMTLADRQGTALSLMSFDADGFKTFNDSHGHDAGDMVLRKLADCLADLFDAREVCCRLGGEEFAVLLPGHDADAARAVAERVRKAVSAMPLTYGSETLPNVTISIGVATYPDSATEAQLLIKRADQALYAAKEAGRNRVESAAPPGAEASRERPEADRPVGDESDETAAPGGTGAA
ncbi:diguanylate cyclase [Pelagovum pacificum]|uniref:diguanylate cyclase n=1 Tax=Pelagovum pacificum TaxID=2588711 RepID=A0A5C5GAN8_9RHOB|nr:diguanylate cyclase [Pelagovum pacificum]QQA41394.1 diguanylate cyclase [Pelagovum pacificum]TNY31803.1 diguanylate cyclase [Pelagovum pacificum]